MPPEEHSPPPGIDALWREHAPAVVRYARRRVPPDQVDEVVAETFVVAWRRSADVPERALPWLLGVARGVSANLRRAERRRDALQDRLAAAERPMSTVVGHDGAVDPSVNDQVTQVRSALARLRDDDRELLLLVAWDGLSREDTARALGCSSSTVAVRLHRARRRLRTALDSGEADPEPDADSSRPVARPRPVTGRST